MKLDKLFADGQKLLVHKKIGKGGEGEVYSLSNVPGYALKAYLPHLAKEREAKIRAMVSSGLAGAAATIAFPHQIVVNERREFVGFMMRLVEKHKEIHELQTPSSRQKHFPNADYRFLVRTAVNIARVFAQAHAANCIVGDINQRGILVSPDATVALIDADSFQVTHNGQQYLCVVGVPEYTPPELQGKSLSNVVRTPDHDAFGLAVSLFQLLCMDRHPFSGRYAGSGDMPLEKAIAEFRFAYSTRATGMTPPPGTVRLTDFPLGIRECFEQAFSPHYVGRRPSPARWVKATEELESSLRVCSRNRVHYFSRSAPECPWCRMEAEYGRPLFVSPDGFTIHLPKGKIDEKSGLVLDVQTLLAAVTGVAIPASIKIPLPQVPTPATPSDDARTARRRQRLAPLQRVIGFGTMIGAAIMFFGFDLPFLVAAAVGAFGGWLTVRAEPAASIVAEHERIAGKIKSRVETLQALAPFGPVLRKKAEALDCITEYKVLAAAYGQVVPDYEKVRRQRQLDAFLSTHLIRGARIAKISSADTASLASFGIATAFDARKRNVQQVYGIGPVKSANIAAWVRRIEARFQFHMQHTPEDRDNIRRMQADIVSKQQGVEDKLKRVIEELRGEARTLGTWQRQPDPELVSLAASLAQCEVDLRYLNMSVPSAPNVPPMPVPSVEEYRRGQAKPRTTQTWRTTAGQARTQIARPAPAGTGTPLCPSCGSRMVRRLARRGRNAGNHFWGCSRYPSCTGTRPI
jgi:DNA-binding helix-hairpin-helix protein with protein kinase domain